MNKLNINILGGGGRVVKLNNEDFISGEHRVIYVGRGKRKMNSTCIRRRHEEINFPIEFV